MGITSKSFNKSLGYLEVCKFRTIVGLQSHGIYEFQIGKYTC